MRKFIPLIAALAVFTAAPAFACKCVPDTDGSQAAKIFADPAVTVADVTVRGYNTHNGQSMLQIDNVRSGGLVAKNIRAKFGTSDCAIIPSQKKMTLLIHNDEDGRYSIMGDCAHSAVMQSIGKGR